MLLTAFHFCMQFVFTQDLKRHRIDHQVQTVITSSESFVIPKVRNFLKCQATRTSVLFCMLSGLNMHAKHMPCRSNASPRTHFPTLITRELLNDNVNIDHSSAKHCSTVRLVGQVRERRAMIFFFSFFFTFLIPHSLHPEKRSDSAVLSTYLPVVPSPLHLHPIPF